MRTTSTLSVLGIATVTVVGLLGACGGSTTTTAGGTTTGTTTTASGSGSTTSTSSGAGGTASSTTSTASGAGGATSTSTSSTTSTGGPDAGCATPANACGTCEQEACESLYCSFFSDSTCVALAKCYEACAGAANGEVGCFEANNDCAAEAFLLLSCNAQECASTCGTANAPGPCGVCQDTHCTSEVNTCWGDKNCIALFECWDECTTASCVATCNSENDAGLGDGEAVLSCRATNCAGTCP